jgi:hypothetical protein
VHGLEERVLRNAEQQVVLRPLHLHALAGFHGVLADGFMQDLFTSNIQNIALYYCVV